MNDMEWDDNARKFTYLLELKDEDGEKLDRTGLKAQDIPEPFTYFNTFESVIEEWRRNHPKDNQLTKVQVNFETGDITIFKKLTEVEVATNRGRQWSTKRFNLNRPSDMQRAVIHSFQ